MRQNFSILKLLLVLCVCSTLLSCDRIRALFNMPTSDQLDQMWRDLKEEAEQKQADSTAKETADTTVCYTQNNPTSAANETSVERQNMADGKYYVVLGRYREQANIDNMKRLLTERDEKPVEIDRNDGSVFVCAGESTTLEEAKDALKRIEKYALSPDELWIFKNN